MKPETTIYHAQYTYSWAKLWIHETSHFEILPCFCQKFEWQLDKSEQSDPSTPGIVNPVIGWKVDNVWFKQKLTAVIEIISKYEFIPTMPNGTGLEDPEEFITTTVFNSIITGATGANVTVYRGNNSWGIPWDTVVYIIILLGIIAITMIVLKIILARKTKASIQGTTKPKSSNWIWFALIGIGVIIILLIM
jgi:hypothetical protein